MCRLFGIVADKKVDPGYYFFDADVPFKDFMEREINRGPHNSGWGIGWFDKGKWNIFKEGKDNITKYDFSKIRSIKSEMLVIHLRHASVGGESTKNTHPFVYGKWIFAHNGSIKREEIIKHLNSDFKRKLKGDTDSEVYFMLIMQYFEESKDIVGAIKKTVEVIRGIEHKGINF